MEISVIIPSYNGSHRITKCLDSISIQSLIPDEVIVVLDGSTDNSLEVLNNYESGFHLVIVQQENKGRAGARNTGAMRAGGDLLFFCDDDIKLDSNAIKNHFESHLNASGIYTGMLKEIVGDKITDFQTYRSTISNNWLKDLPSLEPMKKEQLFLSAANLSIQKKTFNSLGGFDISLKDAEDFEFAIKAHKKNFQIYFLKDAIGWHDDLVDFKNYIRRLREYRSAHLVLWNSVDHIEEFADFSMYLNKSLSLKRIFFWFFSFSLWVELLDKEKISFLPRKLRFKMFDWVSTSLSVHFPEAEI